MIFDEQNLFSDAQSVSATGASTNIIDLGAGGKTWKGDQLVRDIGPGVPLPIRIQLVADATGTSPTLTVTVEVDDNDSFSSAKTVASATQISGGSQGDVVDIRYVPKGTNERYMRLKYTLGGTTPAYKITAGIIMGPQESYS